MCKDEFKFYSLDYRFTTFGFFSFIVRYVKDLEVVTIVSSSPCFLFCFVLFFFVMVKNNQN